MKPVLLLLITLAPAALAEPMPIPPVPPAEPPFSEIAPTPNPDVNAPVAAASEQAKLDLRLYRSTPYDPGLGFAPGSRYRSNEDRKPIQTPGLGVRVPIQ